MIIASKLVLLRIAESRGTLEFRSLLEAALRAVQEELGCSV